MHIFLIIFSLLLNFIEEECLVIPDDLKRVLNHKEFQGLRSDKPHGNNGTVRIYIYFRFNVAFASLNGIIKYLSRFH